MNVLVAGGASGIGYGLAERLIKEGHYVYLCVHKKSEVKTTLEKIKNIDYLDRVSVIKMDITKEKDRNLIFKLDIDCLVNLIGLGIGGSLLNLDIDSIKNNFNVNFFSTLDLIKLYIDSRKEKEGKVVITSSLAGYLPIPFLGSYCSSKVALSTFCECFNKELKKTNLKIKLKLIEPGAYLTGFNEYMIENKEILDFSMFNEDVESIINNQKELFNLIEKRSLNSVINAFDSAINGNSNKFKYKVPILQTIFTKLYLLLFK